MPASVASRRVTPKTDRQGGSLAAMERVMVSLILSLGLCLAVMGIVGWGLLRNLPQPRRAAIIHLCGAALFFGGLLNGIIFWHVAVYLGGNAISGKIEHGRYYLSSHGKLTEVSPAIWQYSYAHTISTWITHPLAGVGWLLMFWTDPDRDKKSNQPSGSPPPQQPPPDAPNDLNERS
jgi:hypothetical protein